jgi:ubiquinone/menaquinone biosynthesis C-methylase UbiE
LHAPDDPKKEEYDRRRVNVYCKLLGEMRANTLLDIGCGDSSITEIISDAVQAKDVYVVDLDYTACNRARKRGLEASCIDVEKQRLPFPNDYFELVLMLQTIAHLANPDNVLKEIRRCLSPDGFLLLSTLNCASWVNRILMALGHPPLGIDLSSEYRYRYPLGIKGTVSGHVHLYTLHSLNELLAYHGLKITKVRGARISWSKTNRISIIDAIDKIMTHSPTLANVIAILCRRF